MTRKNNKKHLKKRKRFKDMKNQTKTIISNKETMMLTF